MRTLRSLLLVTGLLSGVLFLNAPPLAAQAGRCAGLASTPQQVKCVLVNGSFPELEALLEERLPDVTDEDLRLVIEGLAYERGQGNILAMLGLGAIHEAGLGPIPPDLGRAAGYYLDAAAAGATEGMLRVAMIYCDGRIPAPDLECLYFLRNAAEFGQVDALLILAEQLVAKTGDVDGAKTYLEKAIALGVPGAEAALLALLQSRI